MHERERNADIVEESAAKVSNTVPQPRKKDVSVNSFVNEQKQKKEALDQLMAEQKARLASLNSPLPNLPKKVPKVTSSQPKKPYVPPPFPPKSVPAAAPGLSLSELTMKRPASTQSQESSSTPTPATPSPGPAPGLSIAELTMNRTKKPTPAMPSPAPPSNAPAPGLSLAEMTMLKKPSNTNKVAPKSAPVRQRVVRQQITKGEEEDDDDDDDFSAYAKGGDNKDLSIKEIMAKQSKQEGKTKATVSNKTAKDKSKMWGIDMDKFNF